MLNISSFDDFAHATNREIQSTMRYVDQKDLVIALMGTSSEVKEKILSNLTERVWTFIKEEMESSTSSTEEIEEAQKKIVKIAREQRY